MAHASENNARFCSQRLASLLSRAFLACAPLSCPLWRHVRHAFVLCTEIESPKGVVDTVLQATLYHPLTLSYPRDIIHAQTLLAWIQSTECDVIWSGYSELKMQIALCIQKNQRENTAEMTYKTYFTGEDNHITLMESIAGITRGTTGLTSWCGAGVLASWLRDNKAFLSDKRILELGSGVGFLASSILRDSYSTPDDDHRPPSSYVVTDCHPHILETLHHNLNVLRRTLSKETIPIDELEAARQLIENLLVTEELSPGDVRPWTSTGNISVGETSVVVQQLDWRNSQYNVAECDVIIASDVVYARHLLPSLVRLIKFCLGHREGDRLLEEGSHTPSTVCLPPSETSREEGAATASKAAFIACTRRSHETVYAFLKEVDRQHLRQRLVYQAVTDAEFFLFGYNESFVPVRIYQIELQQ